MSASGDGRLLPEGDQPGQVAISGDAPLRVQRDGNRIVVSAQNLAPDETLVVEIPFAPGTLINSPPAVARAAQGRSWGF